jgi:translation initiation factor 1
MAGCVCKTSPGKGGGRTVQPRGGAVIVSREKQGRGGKIVSVVSGLPLNDEQMAALATQLKRRCGAGGGVAGDNIEIQGDHRDTLVAELLKRGFAAKKSGG